MIEVKMNNKQRVHMHFAPKDSDGEAAAIEGTISHVVTEGGDATVEENGTAADGSVIDNANPMFVSGANAMESTITSTADADLGAGVRHIVQEFSVVVSLPEAESFGITQDAPEPKASTPPPTPTRVRR